MALGKRCNSAKYSRNGGFDSEQGLKGLSCVRYTRSFGRKRIVISNDVDILTLDDCPFQTPLKRQRSLEPEKKSLLETMPQDVLIRIICGVDHDDLKQLFHVSTAIREAAKVAKECHFAYSTPKKVRAFRTPIDFEKPSEFEEDFEAPNAPKQLVRSYKPPLNKKDLAVVLFPSPRKLLFSETEGM